MKILIIDSSTEYLTCRFYDDQRKQLEFEKTMISHNNHSENLLPTLTEGLEKTNYQLTDFNKIIVGAGPGSYTGLRIGMVVAKMISFSLDIDLYTISSLFLCGSGYFKNDGIYATTIIAKKNYSYLQIVKVEDGKINILVDDTFLPTEEANKLISDYKATHIFEGDYLISDEIVTEYAKKVDNIHDLVPNYLRKANS